MKKRDHSLPKPTARNDILAELPNLLDLDFTSDTWRVERLFNFGLIRLFIIHLYNYLYAHLQFKDLNRLGLDVAMVT